MTTMSDDVQPSDLEHDDALLTLMSEWFRQARDLHAAVRALLVTHGGYFPADNGDSRRILVECERTAWAHLCALAAQPAPVFGLSEPAGWPRHPGERSPFIETTESVRRVEAENPFLIGRPGSAWTEALSAPAAKFITVHDHTAEPRTTGMSDEA